MNDPAGFEFAETVVADDELPDDVGDGHAQRAASGSEALVCKGGAEKLRSTRGVTGTIPTPASLPLDDALGVELAPHTEAQSWLAAAELLGGESTLWSG